MFLIEEKYNPMVIITKPDIIVPYPYTSFTNSNVRYRYISGILYYILAITFTLLSKLKHFNTDFCFHLCQMWIILNDIVNTLVNNL